MINIYFKMLQKVFITLIIYAVSYTFTFCTLLLVSGRCHADVIFILDSSASVGSFNWAHTKQIVMDMVQGLKVFVLY